MSKHVFGKCQKEWDELIEKGEACHTLRDVVVEKSLEGLYVCVPATAACLNPATVVWLCPGATAACLAKTALAYHASIHADHCIEDLEPLADNLKNCCE